MISASSPNARPSPLSRRWQAAALLWLCAAPIVAQPDGPPAERRNREVHISASKNCLWLVVVDPAQSRLFFRETGGEFDLGRSTQRPIAAQASLDRDLLVFFEDGAVYRYSPAPTDPPTAEPVLPQREIPIEMVGGGGRVHAVISSKAALELPAAAAAESEAELPTFDPGESAYTLALFDGRAWSALAALPASVTTPDKQRWPPRLCLVQEELLLLVPGPQPDQIQHFRFDRKSRQWRARDLIHIQRLAEFRVATVSRVPTLVAVLRSSGEQAELVVLRLPGNAASPDATWRETAEFKTSALPADVPQDAVVTRYTDVVGFNQHLGLLAQTADGRAYVRFARVDDSPAVPSVSVEQVLRGPGVLLRSQGVFQWITLALLLAVLTGLFVFRRGSMIRVVELPPGCALALNAQRMAAWLVDFVPFTIAAAAAVGIPWGEGLGALGAWGFFPAPERGLPEQDVLMWWGLSVFGYTTYSLVMELITGRTVGKVLARVRLVSEAGTRPTAGQVLTRNLTRLIEFMPQFWVFVVLVLLSRNRQRMGDIFARTVAVRLVPGKPPSAESGDGRARAAPDDGEQAGSDDEQAKPPDPDQQRRE